jgi:hypothetical protein
MLRSMSAPLSTDVDDPNARVYFVWDEDLTYAQLREHLRTTDPDQRALWMARVMREARYRDVWRFLDLPDVLRMWPRLERHLGRMRSFWTWLIGAWKSHGLLPRSD